MSELLTVRFPSGATDFRMSDDAPGVGEILRRKGDTWIVEEIASSDDGTTVVTVRSELETVEPNNLGAPVDNRTSPSLRLAS